MVTVTVNLSLTGENVFVNKSPNTKRRLRTRFIGVGYPRQEVSKHSSWKMNAREKTTRGTYFHSERRAQIHLRYV